MEPDLKVPYTGQEVILMVPCKSTSSSGWTSARVLVEARALGLERARPHPFRAANLDPG